MLGGATLLENQRIGMIGAGNMAQALINGLMSGATATVDSIRVVHRGDPERHAQIQERFGLEALASVQELVQWASVIVLCTKPKDMAQALGGVALRPDQLLVSVLAGVPTTAIEAVVGPGIPVVRAMPNTCSTIRESVTSLALGRSAGPTHRQLAQELFSAVGLVLDVQEKDLDVVTALSGSGPAYVYLLIESLVEAGVAHGLSPEVARTLATHTVVGAGRMVLSTGEEPGKLRDKVTSKGGTTQAGLEALRAAGFSEAVGQAVAKATRRSQELSGQSAPREGRGRWVIKIGSSSLTGPGGRLNVKRIEDLAVELTTHGGSLDLLLVSSGAIAAGVGRMGRDGRPQSLSEKQALAAIGQTQLMQAYQRAFGEWGQAIAQVLLTAEDLLDEKRRENARRTLEQLVSWRVLPVVNENDTVATEEISVGDNDTLAAQLAILVGAERLVILTDTEGVYRFDPRSSQAPELVRRLGEGDPLPELGHANRGRGGMITKIAAARLAGAAGIETVIASSHHPGPIGAILRGEEVGTRWTPRTLNSSGS